VVKTQNGLIINILTKYAYTGKGSDIHSSTQLDDLKTKMRIDQLILVVYSIPSLEGFILPLDF